MHDKLDLFINFLAKSLGAVGGIFLVLMTGLACANMTLRAFSAPIQGTYELMGFMGAVVAAFSLGFAQISGGHVSVTVFENKFPKPLDKAIKIFTSVISAVFFLLCAVETSKWSAFLVDTGELSETLGIIYYPFTYAVALGCLAMALILFAQTLKLIIPKGQDK